MAIKNRIKEAIDKLNQDDYENALIQVNIAIDATAKKEYPKEKTSHRCKKFLRENQAFITRVGLGLLEIHGDIKFGKEGKTLEEVLYNIIRCTLLHEGEMSEKIEITSKVSIGMSEDGKVIIPLNLIWAMILAVIGSKVNANERLPEHYSVTIGTIRRTLKLRLNEFWGKKEEIFELVRQHNK